MGPGLEPEDRLLLGFIAEHRFIRLDHAQALLAASSRSISARLRRLERAGHVRCARPFGGRDRLFLITAPGLQATGSRLRPPKLRLSCYEHDIGVAWLWLAARAGAFGELRGAASERRMRSYDACSSSKHHPIAVRVPGMGDAGYRRLHYPDLLLVAVTGQRVALELELSAKGRARREQILSAYAADVRIGGVIYLVANAALRRSIAESARRMGIEHLVRVQPIETNGSAGNRGSRSPVQASSRAVEALTR